MLVSDSWLLEEGETEPIVTIQTPQNSAWLQDWNNHMEGVSTLVLVPAPALPIHTPLVKPKWAQALQTYPLKSLAEFCFQALLSASALDTTTLETSQKCTQEPRRCSPSARDS